MALRKKNMNKRKFGSRLVKVSISSKLKILELIILLIGG